MLDPDIPSYTRLIYPDGTPFAGGLHAASIEAHATIEEILITLRENMDFTDQ
jgi:hypothetical protein